MWYRLRKDKLISEENVRCTAYGIDVYAVVKRIRSIKAWKILQKDFLKF